MRTLIRLKNLAFGTFACALALTAFGCEGDAVALLGTYSAAAFTVAFAIEAATTYNQNRKQP